MRNTGLLNIEPLTRQNPPSDIDFVENQFLAFLGIESEKLPATVVVGPSATVHVSLLQPPVLLASGSELGSRY